MSGGGRLCLFDGPLQQVSTHGFLDETRQVALVAAALRRGGAVGA
jgi:hypothetical protein